MANAATWQSAERASVNRKKDQSGCIGPNAVVQVFNALDNSCGNREVMRIAKLAGLLHHRTNAPTAMVDERDVVALHKTVRTEMATDQGDQILWQAGERTANYILANRIPKPVQFVLRALPPRPAARLLLKAIANNAWTFAGSGTFAYQNGEPTFLTFDNCPACTEVYRTVERCSYYTATFQGLFQAMVHPSATVVDDLSPSTNGRVRRFVLDWPS